VKYAKIFAIPVYFPSNLGYVNELQKQMPVPMCSFGATFLK
jgi:hypothetical protein